MKAAIIVGIAHPSIVSAQGTGGDDNSVQREADRINVDAPGSSSSRQLRQDIAQWLDQAQLCHLRCICKSQHDQVRYHPQEPYDTW